MSGVQLEGMSRASHEIEHGKWLAAGDTEWIWGWGTPACTAKSVVLTEAPAGPA